MIINPSTSGWLDKLLNDFLKKESKFNDLVDFYQSFQMNGFVYGHIISNDYQSEDFKLTQEEIYKLFYVKAIYHLDLIYHQDDDFIKRLIVFYKNTVSESWLNFDQFMVKENSSTKIESIISNRIKFFHRYSSSKYIQNLLVFLDILLYYRFLTGEKINVHTLHFLEQSAESILTAVNLKSNQIKLKDLFKPFIHLLNEQNGSQDYIDDINLELSDLGKYFFTDLAILNHYISHRNLNDLEGLILFSQTLGLSKLAFEQAIFTFANFVFENTKAYNLFEKQTFHKSLLQNTQSQMFLLLNRNKGRLVKEINNNKKLLNILSRSTFQQLSSDERKYVKVQLLEICKSIPSLAIFALPGGGLLLPILVRFLPQMLPNSFNENKD